MVQAKILVLDADVRPYEPLRSGLAAHGYDIHLTMMASDALSLVEAHAYQAALVALPSAQDEDVCNGLQTLRPDLPLIIVSCPGARFIPPPIARVADNTVGKPLTLDALRLMLDRTLELSLLRSQLRRERQGLGNVLASLNAPAGSPQEPTQSEASLEEALVQKLRTIVPNMEGLGRGSLHRVVLSHVEKLLVSFVWTECGGNQVKSAEMLGINRNTLRKKLRDFGIASPR